MRVLLSCPETNKSLLLLFSNLYLHSGYDTLLESLKLLFCSMYQMKLRICHIMKVSYWYMFVSEHILFLLRSQSFLHFPYVCLELYLGLWVNWLNWHCWGKGCRQICLRWGFQLCCGLIVWLLGCLLFSYGFCYIN